MRRHSIVIAMSHYHPPHNQYPFPSPRVLIRPSAHTPFSSMYVTKDHHTSQVSFLRVCAKLPAQHTTVQGSPFIFLFLSLSTTHKSHNCTHKEPKEREEMQKPAFSSVFRCGTRHPQQVPHGTPRDTPSFLLRSRANSIKMSSAQPLGNIQNEENKSGKSQKALGINNRPRGINTFTYGANANPGLPYR